MKSVNFEFLREKWPEMASLGGFAEQYAWPDPAGALVKLRAYIESLIHRFYDENELSKPQQASLMDLLNQAAFKQAVPSVVLNALHSIRIAGNKAAHAEPIHRFNVHELLHNAFDLGRWLYIVSGGLHQDCPDYKAPEKPKAAFESAEALKREKRLIQGKLAANEMEMLSLLSELEVSRTKIRVAEKRIEEFEALLNTGKAVADVLGFNEADTRKRLIDTQLAAAGWDIGDGGANTPDVHQEERVEHQPTKTGVGYADYVLWDDNGMPLAVIEAKKTANGAELGQEQARLYADGLKKMHGQRPVIFYTNGFDIFIWDDAQCYPPRSLYGFYSKDSLQYLIFQRNNRKALDSTFSKT